MERRKKGLSGSRGRGKWKGAPAGAGVIVDIQRGKYAISRPHKSGQSDEPPRSAALSFYAARGSSVTYMQAVVYRSVNITRARATPCARMHSHAKPRDPTLRDCLSGNALRFRARIPPWQKIVWVNSTTIPRDTPRTLPPRARVVGEIYGIAETGERNSKRARVGFLRIGAKAEWIKRRNAGMSNILVGWRSNGLDDTEACDKAR